MSDLQAQDWTPRSEGSHVPQFLRLAFSSWITIMAMALQVVLCGLVWALAGRLSIVEIIPFSDNLASLIQNNPSDTNMLITVMSTALAMIGSTCLGITVRHALTFRLPRGVPLSLVIPWIQLAKKSFFRRPRRHPGWTLLSMLWVAVTGFQTAAWSNLLTPVTVVQQFPVSGMEIDLLSPALSDFVLNDLGLPYVTPTTRNYTLTRNVGPLANVTGYFSQAGKSATMASFSPGYPVFIAQFNSSTGGLNPLVFQDGRALRDDYRGLSTSYTILQQGYTANISCMVSSSPTITLNNTASAANTFESPSGAFNYTLETWSWSTNCSGNGQYYTGDVDIRVSTSSDGSTGNGLFATSVCFYQGFSGPSNQSFLVLMQLPNNSFYNNYYSVSNPDLPTVCQFTPVVTTVEVQYNETGLANVSNVLNQTLLPDASWPVASIHGFIIWATYFASQGPYYNSFAEGPIEVMQMFDPNGDITPVLEQYLRGIFEYLGTGLRGFITSSLRPSPDWQPLPNNMATRINGTMNVQTIGWRFYPRTQGVALAVITLITTVTAVSGIFALSEAICQDTVRDTLQRGDAREFDPTHLMDVLAASSTGSLANALSRCKTEEDREKLMVELAVTDKGQTVLNARADGADDARKG